MLVDFEICFAYRQKDSFPYEKYNITEVHKHLWGQAKSKFKASNLSGEESQRNWKIIMKTT